MRFFDDVRALKGSLAELRSVDAAEEEKASFDLAVSAYRFSKNTREVVDDKLSFSATLMRAGEVHAANRLIAEVEEDVHAEEVALVQKITEVQVARSERRTKMTRLRLARLLVTAMLGAALMGASAIGMAAVSLFNERGRSKQPARVAIGNAVRNDQLAALGEAGKTTIRIGDVVVALDKDQLSVFRDIQNGVADPDMIEQFLASLPAGIADSVRRILAVAVVPIERAVEAAAPASPPTSGPAAQAVPDQTKSTSTSKPTTASGADTGSETKGTTTTDDDDDDGGIIPLIDDLGV